MHIAAEVIVYRPTDIGPISSAISLLGLTAISYRHRILYRTDIATI